MRSPGIRLHKLALFGWAVIITAVLLLLSLPVLAGKSLILLALIKAIYWKLSQGMTLSIENIWIKNLYKILRDYTPKYIFYRNYSNERNINDLSHLPFAKYLAGLIEGDGTIVVPTTLRSPKGRLNYPSIQIVFQLKDLPLALIIQKELGLGSLHRKKGVNAYVLSINSYQGLILLINLLNGNMKTPKIYSLYNLIDFYKDRVYIEKKPINKDPIDYTPWLSGFIESDGSFQVRSTTTGKYPKFECKLEISQRRVDHKGFSNLEFLNYIAIFLETEVKEIRSNNPKPEYRVRTTNLKGNNKIKDYFIKFPLFGTKHLDSLDWIKVLDLFNKGEHKTNLGKEKIIEIKSTMNNKRTDFYWNHLQNFYKLNA